MSTLAWISLALLACDGGKVSTDDSATVDSADSAADDSAADDSATEDSDDSASDDSGTSDQTRQTVLGTITWGVDFDASAESAGSTDCAYTRTYTGVEDRSLPWICPGCELLFRADVEITEGYDDCYGQVSSAAPADEEWLGYRDGQWLRGGSSALSERGASSFDGEAWSVTQWVEDYPAPSGGTLTFDIQGSLSVGEEPGDSAAGWTASESYACGWPKADPPPYEGDYVLVMEETMPDGVFQDACEDYVRLHDFKGRYLVIEVSAMDCPPCQSAAQQEPAFVEAMAAEGLDVTVITMLAPSLSNTGGTPTTAQLEQWINNFGLHDPVLADRLWGPSVAGAYMADDFGYPTFVVVDTELKAFYAQTGFSSYDAFGELIRARAAGE